jgi:hypothetical protein
MMRAMIVGLAAALAVIMASAFAEAAAVVGHNVDFPGSWSRSCFEGKLIRTILTAKCHRTDGSVQESDLDIATCADPVSAGNQNGQLVCESGPAGTGGAGASGSDGGGLPPGTAEPQAPIGPVANFAGDWRVSTERGDELRLNLRQKDNGIDGEIKFSPSSALVLGGGVKGKTFTLQWFFQDSTKRIQGSGQLTLTSDRTFRGKLLLEDGSPLQGGIWNGTRTSESGGGGGEAQLPEGSSPAEPKQPAGGGSGTVGDILDCSDRGSLRTGPDNGAKVTLSFHNGSSGTRTLNWIDRDGNDVTYATIEAGDTVAQQTFASHIWELNDLDGACVLIFRAADRSETVEVP